MTKFSKQNRFEFWISVIRNCSNFGFRASDLNASLTRNDFVALLRTISFQRDYYTVPMSIIVFCAITVFFIPPS